MLIQLVIDEIKVELLIEERTLAIVFPPNIEIDAPPLPWLLTIVVNYPR